MYGQRFQGNLSHAGITYRKRAGELWDLRSLDRTVFSIPVHASSVKTVTLDSDLLSGLLKFRDTEVADWGRWQNAISCFRQGNTDNETVRLQVEWVLLCGAFQRLLNTPSDHKDVATKLSETLKPNRSVFVRDTKRVSARFLDANSSLRYEWMKEFYRIRGDFAHGKLATVQPMAWTPLEHLVLASISFPLCVKHLLQEKGYYSLTDTDEDETNAFEVFADQVDFLSEPPDSTGSTDSWWSRVISQTRRERRHRKALESLHEAHTNKSTKD
jgi:hypothetical protein